MNFVLEMSKKLRGFIDDDSDDDDFEPKKTKPLKKRTAVDADGDDFASKKQKKRKLKDEASHKTSTQDKVGSMTTTTTGIHILSVIGFSVQALTVLCPFKSLETRINQ